MPKAVKQQDLHQAKNLQMYENIIFTTRADT